jgi:hypothetical protein
VNTTYPDTFPPELNTQYATAIISPYVLTIPSQGIVVIIVTFSRPSMLDTERIPVFSGYINIQSSNNESFHLPYMGVAYNMSQVTVTDFEYLPPWVSNSSNSSEILDSSSINVTFNMTVDQPQFNWRLVMGSALVRLDVLGSGNQTEVVGVNILGSVPGFPMYWIPRDDLTSLGNYENAIWNGTLSTGVQLPAGNYMFLYRALKIFGDQNNNDDYENWTSPVFGIEYATQSNISLNTTTITTTITTTHMTTNKARTAAIYNGKLLFFPIVMCFLSILGSSSRILF